jgi:predicted DNA-binding WGR domain protein
VTDFARYECVGGRRQSAFWQWQMSPFAPSGWRVLYTWGRIGTAGQSKAVIFESRQLAEWSIGKAVEAKRRNGYKLASTFTIGPERIAPSPRAVVPRRPPPPPAVEIPPIETVRRIRRR